MPRIIWSHSSIADLRAIDTYLDAVDPAAATRILRLIRLKADLLKRHPAAGAVIEAGVRKLGVRGTRYVIVYAVAAGRVEVLRVRHAMEDWRPSDVETP